MFKWCLEKWKSKNTKKITKGTKNVRNPHIHCTLPILHFFELLKNIWDFIWLRYCLNKFITLRRCSNESWKKSKSKNTKKIRKGMKNVRNPHILQFFELFKKIWDFIWHGYCLNRFITLRRCSNNARKNHTSKILKN